MNTDGTPSTRIVSEPVLPREGQDAYDHAGIELNMQLLEVVSRLRPMARFQQRFLNDPEMAEVSFSSVVVDPDAAWLRFCLTPGAGPAATDDIATAINANTSNLTQAIAGMN